MESIEEAAARLLAGLKRGKRPAGERPAEIHNSTECPEVEKEAGEIGAYSSPLAGQGPATDRGRDLKAVVVLAANDNAGWTSGEYDHRASPTRLYPDENAMPADRAKVAFRGFGEF